MQNFFDTWLPRYYPRLNKEAFSTLLQEASDHLLPANEFQYLVLGCGYLYQVYPPDPENAVRRLKQQLSELCGEGGADALVDEQSARKIKALTKQSGLLIGPGQRSLSEKRRPGQLPNPASKIAALTIARWVVKRRPTLEPAPWACDLYSALTSKSLKPETFKRYQKRAEQETVAVWKQQDESVKVPAINHLIEFFDNRFQQFQRDGFPLREASKNPGLLYPIDFLEPVLRAADVEIKDKKMVTVTSLFEKQTG